MTKDDEIRTMVCPFCGHIFRTRSIGVVHCGPHVSADGKASWPAVQMLTVKVLGEGNDRP